MELFRGGYELFDFIISIGVNEIADKVNPLCHDQNLVSKRRLASAHNGNCFNQGVWLFAFVRKLVIRKSDSLCNAS
ncbi:MAG: hypothetical protein ACD_17C00049G0001 [uncultured bacterium]|nr:MAG: hypothetical protein ACD_17C00049G0001 [uncultured bacterium]